MSLSAGQSASAVGLPTVAGRRQRKMLMLRSFIAWIRALPELSTAKAFALERNCWRTSTPPV